MNGRQVSAFRLIDALDTASKMTHNDNLSDLHCNLHIARETLSLLPAAYPQPKALTNTKRPNIKLQPVVIHDTTPTTSPNVKMRQLRCIVDFRSCCPKTAASVVDSVTPYSVFRRTLWSLLQVHRRRRLRRQASRSGAQKLRLRFRAACLTKNLSLSSPRMFSSMQSKNTSAVSQATGPSK